MRKTRHSVDKNIERIADQFCLMNYTLESINFYLDDIAYVLKEYQREYKVKGELHRKTVKDGLSSICKNEYANNLRIDEVLAILREAYPNKTFVEGRRENAETNTETTATQG